MTARVCENPKCRKTFQGHGGRVFCVECAEARRVEQDRIRARGYARRQRQIVRAATDLVGAWRSSDGDRASEAIKRLTILIPLILAVSLAARAEICDPAGAGLLLDGRSHCEPYAGSCREVLPTPTIIGDWPAGLDDPREGVRVYYREPGGVWQMGCERTCEEHPDVDEHGVPLPLDRFPPRLWCRGLSAPLALQRCANLTPGRVYHFALKAWNAAGESPVFSDPVEVCWPDLQGIN